MRENVREASEVFAKHGDFIRAVVSSKVDNEEHVEEIVHDCFLSLVRRPIPARVRDVRRYLYIAAINDVADFGRRCKRYRELKKEYRQNVTKRINNNDPENALEIEDECEKTLALLRERLSASQAQAIALRFKEDMSIQDVAKKMKIKPRSVSRYICVGLRQLRRMLATDEDIRT